MTKIPSIKTLSLAFGDNAKALRRILAMPHNELSEHPAAAARIRECYHRPAWSDLRLTALNATAGTYGVEGVQSRSGSWATYLNTGDTYAPTIIFWQGKYRVQSLGDFVEIQERKGTHFD